jgi:hypothetical protein
MDQIIINYLKPYGPKEIRVFGSYARGEMNSESDIDISYTLNKNITLFDLVRINWIWKKSYST